MARPKSPPFTLGAISFTAHPTQPGMTQARGRYIDWHGKRQEVTASGRTQAAAKRALAVKVNAARTKHKGGNGTINESTKLTAVAAIWLDEKEREQKAPATMRAYRGYVQTSINKGTLSALTVSEANDLSRIKTWLKGIADERGETAARQSRKVLSGIMALAEEAGAIHASALPRVKTPRAKPGSTGDRRCNDPECDWDCGKRHLDTSRAFTPTQAAAVLRAAEGAKADMGDLAHFLFGTGVRISEALYCTAWADVDLERLTVRVRGTKTRESDRILPLSDDLAKVLRKRGELHGTEGLVFGVTYFASKLGKPRDRNNVGKAMRRVFAAAGTPWAGTHTFRRTVASWMDEAGASLAEIANQLGHADTNVTAGYLGRRGAITRAADVMVLPTEGRAALRVVS